MENLNRDAIHCLNNLIETCKDGQEGFRAAADAVKSSELKALFNNFARQRAQFAGELQAEVRRLGEDPETAGSFSGSIHRGWMNLKSAITGRSDADVIADCERGEDSAIRNYREALADLSLTSEVRAIVGRQSRQVEAAHDRIRLLELERAA